MSARKPKRIALGSSAQVLKQCESIFTRYTNGELQDDQARVAGYLLQIASGVIRTCALEQRVQELESKLAQIESKPPSVRV